MRESDSYDDAVIGAGVIGLAHAYQLARRGRRVVVLERDRRASGASIRNFGMLWPIGQPAGERRVMARRSVAIWLEILEESGVWHQRCGSLHVACAEDEASVLREFAAARPDEDRVELLGPAEAGRIAPLLRRDRVLLALFSPGEVCVDPREAIGRLPGWMSRSLGVDFRFGEPVLQVGSGSVISTGGRIEADRVWICSGDETRVLFPELLRTCGLIHCKLQMMRSQPLEPEERIGPMLAGGLTLRHYESFRDCPSLGALRERIERETPWFDQLGIHVMVSQHGRGELTIGDSHEYDGAIEPFDKDEVERLILEYLDRFFDRPALRIASRWHGTYAKLPDRPYLTLSPCPGVVVITGVGGAGMTLSFGLAERVVERVLAGK